MQREMAAARVLQVEIGGRPADAYSQDIETQFHGCLARVLLNGVDLLAQAPRSSRDCAMPRPQILSFRSAVALIHYSFLPFSLEFRLLPQPTALLSILDAMNATLLQLRVDEHHQLLLEADSRQIRQFALPAVDVADGAWVRRRLSADLLSSKMAPIFSMPFRSNFAAAASM